MSIRKSISNTEGKEHGSKEGGGHATILLPLLAWEKWKSKASSFNPGGSDPI